MTLHYRRPTVMAMEVVENRAGRRGYPIKSVRTIRTDFWQWRMTPALGGLLTRTGGTGPEGRRNGAYLTAVCAVGGEAEDASGWSVHDEGGIDIMLSAVLF